MSSQLHLKDALSNSTSSSNALSAYRLCKIRNSAARIGAILSSAANALHVGYKITQIARTATTTSERQSQSIGSWWTCSRSTCSIARYAASLTYMKRRASITWIVIESTRVPWTVQETSSSAAKTRSRTIWATRVPWSYSRAVSASTKRVGWTCKVMTGALSSSNKATKSWVPRSRSCWNRNWKTSMMKRRSWRCTRPTKILRLR